MTIYRVEGSVEQLICQLQWAMKRGDHQSSQLYLVE